MKVYYFVLAFFLIMVALGQQEEDNAADSAIATLSQSIKNVDVTLQIAELDGDTTARFKRANGTEAPLSPAKLVLYRIVVHNSGTVQLSDVILAAELAEGIQYETSKYYEEVRGDLKARIDPDPSNEDLKTNVTWNLAFMNPGEIKSILLEAYVKKEVDEKGIRVEVSGRAPDGDEVEDSDSSPSDECYLRYISGPGEGTECFPVESGVCEIKCPDWAKVI